MSIEVKYYMIRNWDKFQHYKDRNPPWIKLHTTILDDPDFEKLTPMARLTFLLLGVLAARCSNKIPYSKGWIARKLSLSRDKAKVDELINNGWLVPYDASKSQADPKQSAIPEERRGRGEERRGDQPSSIFDIFWEAYPRKVGKGAARKAWAKLSCPEAGDFMPRMLAAIEAQKKTEQWMADKGKFIPHPSTWLNREGWSDDIEIQTEKEHRPTPTNRPRFRDKEGLWEIIDGERRLISEDSI
jgi:hypothetical protein